MPHQTNEPIYQRATSLNQQDPYNPNVTDGDSTATNVEPNNPGTWGASLFGCSKHVLAALLVPWWSVTYTARGINKPIFIGVGMAVCYYGGIVTAALWATDDDEPSTTIGGIKFGLWQNLTTTFLPNVPITAFMLRGWFRAYHEIPGSRRTDMAVACGLPCCALAQMSEHTSRVKMQNAHKSTLPPYAA